MDEIEKSIKKLALLHFRTPPRVGVRAMVKLSAVFFLDESSITIGLGRGGYESAIASKNHLQRKLTRA